MDMGIRLNLDSSNRNSPDGYTFHVRRHKSFLVGADPGHSDSFSVFFDIPLDPVVSQ